MIDILLGMIGFIIAGAVFAAGFYFGQNKIPKIEKVEITEEDKRKNELFKKKLNAIANYSGTKGRRS